MAKTKKTRLRTGFTTGTAAAAAAKGAILFILDGEKPSKVEIELLTGGHITIPIYTCNSTGEKKAKCTVIKDAGDDPDITHKAEIGAVVTLFENKNKSRIVITGGTGVGTVTKPGLEINPGEPAINLGPRQMITQTIREILEKNKMSLPVKVEIFVPEGKTLARKTLNQRLGIVGGISILGTTGIVTPMSHDAYIATIQSSMSVAKACGITKLVLTTGRRSERYSQALWPNLPEEAFIQIGDFFSMSLKEASKKGFASITLAAFFGKSLKMAQGVPHTHAAKVRLTLDKLADWSLELTKNKSFSEKILSANTARHAFDFILDQYPEVILHVGKQMVKSAELFAGDHVHIRGIIFDYNGNMVFNSDSLS
ncbi:MAG: cobalt-precorrin-5B (C1)-methyltransferase [Desulfobacteraceae bacterium Eth-SRB2]|nr:MAG: cobalt-precorrin-5B (C1)-methyltransferase [Desulfobacteraceae bacterium Eth-SRB2]